MTNQIAEEEPLQRHADAGLESGPLPSSMADLERRSRTLIRERPIVAVLAALGVGYVMARLLSRGSR